MSAGYSEQDILDRDERIEELERELKVLSGRLERELDRAIPIVEERNAARAESDFHRGQRDAAWEARDKSLAALADCEQRLEGYREALHTQTDRLMKVTR